MSTAVLFVTTLLSASAPYVRTHTSSDAESHCLWWPTSTITWQQNTVGNTSVSPKAFDAVTASFATWQLAMQQCGSGTLVEGPRSGSRVVGYNPGGTNTNLVLFRLSSCANPNKVPTGDECWQEGTCGNKYDCWELSPSLLGITTVTYDTATGRVLDADIELNAANNYFTTMTNPVCSGTPNQSCASTDVQNTMTHEIGHLLGLGHAQGRDSTMNATASIGDTNKRVLDVGTKSFVCEVYTRDLAPKDCVIDASSDVLGPPANVKAGCASADAGPGFVALLAAIGLLGPRRRRVATLATLLLAGPSAWATTALVLDVPALSRSSDAVVHATVERVESRWTPDHARIVTDVHLVVLETLKGVPTPSVIITQPGGAVGRIGQRVEGLARFDPGEEVIVFLDNRGPRFAVTGLSQGKFHVDRATAKVPFARQSKSEALFVDPLTAQPVSVEPLTLPLDVLRAQVRAVATPPSPPTQPVTP